MLGQALGLPLFMLLFTFVGLAVTSATVTIFGNMISDPIALASQLPGLAPKCLALLGEDTSCSCRFESLLHGHCPGCRKSPACCSFLLLAFLLLSEGSHNMLHGNLCLSEAAERERKQDCFVVCAHMSPSSGLVLATITTNLAANAVPAANALVNLNPRVFSFTKSAVAMAIVALITRPWLLISSSKVSVMASLPSKALQQHVAQCQQRWLSHLQQHDLQNEPPAELLQQLCLMCLYKNSAASAPAIKLPLKPKWSRNLHTNCFAAKVAFFRRTVNQAGDQLPQLAPQALLDTCFSEQCPAPLKPAAPCYRASYSRGSLATQSCWGLWAVSCWQTTML